MLDSCNNARVLIVNSKYSELQDEVQADILYVAWKTSMAQEDIVTEWCTD